MLGAALAVRPGLARRMVARAIGAAVGAGLIAGPALYRSDLDVILGRGGAAYCIKEACRNRKGIRSAPTARRLPL